MRYIQLFLQEELSKRNYVELERSIHVLFALTFKSILLHLLQVFNEIYHDPIRNLRHKRVVLERG